jgi:hypothetical protein
MKETKDLHSLPTERDLPPARVARMRADLVTAMGRPRARARSLRLRLAITVAAVVAVAGGVLLAVPSNQDDGEYLVAMGIDEMSPTQHRAAERCLAWNGGRYPVSMSDLAVATQQGYRTQVLFLSEWGYLDCDVTMEPGEESHGGSSGVVKWPHGELLPGPVELLGMGMTGDPGEVAVAGRVSERVHRLELEHGNGHTTAARLENGAFALISEGDVQLDAELVGYDAEGREIYRWELLEVDNPEPCYTDESGGVIYGEPGPACQPAEPWNRR